MRWLKNSALRYRVRFCFRTRTFPPDINSQSLRNLDFPLDWEAIFDYVKFPAFLKPHDGGGWKDVFHVHNPDDFFHAYHQTRDLCMTLQAAVSFSEYFRCYVVGQEKVRIMSYDPKRPHHERYVLGPNMADPELLKRVEKDALTLCKALGYDLNTVEFAVEEGVPYAIDFMNPAPDADLHSVGRESFDWIVNAVAELAVKKAQAAEKVMTGMNWSAFLSGTSEAVVAKSAPKKAGGKEGGCKEDGGEEGGKEDGVVPERAELSTRWGVLSTPPGDEAARFRRDDVSLARQARLELSAFSRDTEDRSDAAIVFFRD